MDAHTFDRWTTAVAQHSTRRTALRLLTGGVLGGLLSRRGSTPARAVQLDDVGLIDTGPLSTCEAQGLTDCFGVCTDVSSDPANCGACGTLCAAGYACIGGWCQELYVDQPDPALIAIITDSPCLDPANNVVCRPGLCINLRTRPRPLRGLFLHLPARLGAAAAATVCGDRSGSTRRPRRWVLRQPQHKPTLHHRRRRGRTSLGLVRVLARPLASGYAQLALRADAGPTSRFCQ